MENKSSYFGMLKDVEKKIATLPADNYIKKALIGGTLKRIESKIHKLPVNELEPMYYPPLFLFLFRNDLPTIMALNKDILLIKENSSPKSFNNLIDFLESSEKEARKWSSGFFEVFIKARLLKKFPKSHVILDKELPNGRNLDAALKLNDKWINFEVTILSSSDDDYYAYNRFIEECKNNPDEVLIRPGKYDAPNSKSPSLYYDEFRVFRKVYDKIADKKLDVDRSQMAPDEPNILLLLIGDAISVLSDSMGIGWAFDELFADQPKSRINPLLRWIEVEYGRLALGAKWYRKNYDKVVYAPRKLSGVVIFNGCDGKIIDSRINYNANSQHKISHREMAKIEEIFGKRPIYLGT